ncbi:MAG: phage tail assembly protein [Gammaproteobacteria bacterium HGW-Gammaproteobacteria-8]|nr:MAG: phage tail assembly protein [Gammaproteobacteria bacterium HGW-Gammaproteobacteria-8]
MENEEEKTTRKKEETLKLVFPFDHKGQHLAEVTMRRPKVGDMLVARKGKGDDAEQELMLFASLTGVPPEAFQEMDMLDYQKLQGIYRGFLS